MKLKKRHRAQMTVLSKKCRIFHRTHAHGGTTVWLEKEKLVNLKLNTIDITTCGIFDERCKCCLLREYVWRHAARRASPVS